MVVHLYLQFFCTHHFPYSLFPCLESVEKIEIEFYKLLPVSDTPYQSRFRFIPWLLSALESLHYPWKTIHCSEYKHAYWSLRSSSESCVPRKTEVVDALLHVLLRVSSCRNWKKEKTHKICEINKRHKSAETMGEYLTQSGHNTYCCLPRSRHTLSCMSCTILSTWRPSCNVAAMVCLTFSGWAIIIARTWLTQYSNFRVPSCMLCTVSCVFKQRWPLLS